MLCNLYLISVFINDSLEFNHVSFIANQLFLFIAIDFKFVVLKESLQLGNGKG
jgi:hypothetical protein